VLLIAVKQLVQTPVAPVPARGGDDAHVVLERRETDSGVALPRGTPVARYARPSTRPLIETAKHFAAAEPAIRRALEILL
jgi:hypothetical protein